MAHNDGMTRHLYILTGASRGMGLALARRVLTPQNQLLCMARRPSDELLGAEQWAIDLADAPAAAQRLAEWLSALDPGAFSGATLVNNAGVIPRIAPIGEVPAQDMANALRVGLEAPMALTGAFLRATAGWRVPRRVLNISSGLGRRAMASQASYCAAKAGMDHFSRCVALEEALRPNGARIVSLAPGVIDTDMQVQLRAGDPSAFPDLANFVGMKDKGLLMSPDEAAGKLLAYLARPDFGDNPVADVRDA